VGSRPPEVTKAIEAIDEGREFYFWSGASTLPTATDKWRARLAKVRGFRPGHPTAPVGSEHAEGSVAKSIEQQTAKLPSDLFLWAAIGSIAASATLHLAGNKNGSVFVGQWAPTFLILGLYNKLVKQHGSDSTDTRARA
jgi:hypothetical protein